MAPPAPSEPGLHRFRRTSGSFTGWTGLVVVVLALGFVAFDSPDRTGLRVCLGLVVAGLLIWVVLLRPHARATRDTLVLANMLSDLHVPLARIDDVSVRHTLNVWVGDARYICAGIGRSTRRMLRDQVPTGTISSALSGGRRHDNAQDDYADFVEQTITDLARTARRDQLGVDREVRRQWALPEIAALAVAGVAFVAALLVL